MSLFTVTRTLFLAKEILVQSLEFENTAGTEADGVLDHQLREALSVYQNDPLRNA